MAPNSDRCLIYSQSPYCNVAYSSCACFRIEMSGSASFQKMRKSYVSCVGFAKTETQDATNLVIKSTDVISARRIRSITVGFLSGITTARIKTPPA